jgi:hypothetical protein
VEESARESPGRKKSGVEDGSHLGIDQLDVRPIVRPSAGTKCSEGREDCIGESEEVDSEIDEVRAEIEPKPSTWSRIFTPALANEWAEAIHVRLEVHYLAKRAGGED